MTEKSLDDKKEKFFFNMNIFDEGHVEEEDIPPPPTFSEAELAAARKQAFDEGRQHGIDEAKKSRAELVAQALDGISKDISTLSAAEHKREKIFEEEVIRLTTTIFESLFPLYNKTQGFEELKDNLRQILHSQHGAHEISVSVTPETAEGTEKMLAELSSRGLNIEFTVSGDENLSQGACKLSWTDGGAIIDREDIAQKIRAILEQKLAGHEATGHDGDTKDNTSAGKNDIIEAEKVEKPDE